METLARIPELAIYAATASLGLVCAFLVCLWAWRIPTRFLRGKGLESDKVGCADKAKHGLVWDAGELDHVRKCGCPQPYTRKRFERDLQAVIEGDMSVEQLHEKICSEGGQIPKRERVVPSAIQKARETLALVRERLLSGVLAPATHEPVLKDTASPNPGQIVQDIWAVADPLFAARAAPFKVGDWVVVKDRLDRALAEVVGYHPGPEGNMVRVRFEWAEILLRAESLLIAVPINGEMWLVNHHCGMHPECRLSTGVVYHYGDSDYLDSDLRAAVARGCARPVRYGRGL